VIQLNSIELIRHLLICQCHVDAVSQLQKQKLMERSLTSIKKGLANHSGQELHRQEKIYVHFFMQRCGQYKNLLLGRFLKVTVLY